jgi:hypothetical protein
MHRRVKTLIFSLIIGTSLFGVMPVAKAEPNNAENLVEQAVKYKSFYYYNEAYSLIMQMSDESQKNILLTKLASISSAAWNDDIKNIYKMLQDLVNTASGKIYDDIQTTINVANIQQIDKDYLLGEVTSWGKRLVWTEDYSEGVSCLIDAWSNISRESITKAENAINNIKNQYSKDYLLYELTKLKKKSEENIIQNVLPVISSTEAYKEIIKYALENFDDKLSFEVQGYNESSYNLDIINEIINENPIIDYGYEGASVKITWTGDGSIRKCEITFKYKKTKEEMLMMKTKTEQKSAEIIKNIIKPDMNDYEKALAIHDYIVNNASYDKENYYRGTIPAESYTDYGVLIIGKAVCEGYAKALFRLLNSSGVKCLYVSGTANNSPHAWNIVQLEGDYYHIDATWDDPITADGSNVLRHDYFNVTDDVMMIDHSWDRSLYPQCNTNSIR